MGNIVSPAKTPKVTKLKHIVHVLAEQQRKIKRSKQDAMRRQRQLHGKMKNSMARKTEKRYADMGLDDDIRKMAEEIAHQRHRILDLKVCVDTLRNLQYKVQGILNAYYTHTTLVVVNNAIKKSNITVEKMDKDQGMATVAKYRIHFRSRVQKDTLHQIQLPPSHALIIKINRSAGFDWRIGQNKGNERQSEFHIVCPCIMLLILLRALCQI